MDFGTTTLAFSAGAAALAASVKKLTTRLQLSKAKHWSLSGHARLARRMAALVPFYAYDESQFFRADDAPEEVAARRHAGFMRLAEQYRTRFAETLRRTGEVTDGHYGLQLTAAYWVSITLSR